MNFFTFGMKLSLKHFLITEIILLIYQFRSIYESIRNSSLFLDFSNWKIKVKISKFRVVQSLKEFQCMVKILREQRYFLTLKKKKDKKIKNSYNSTIFFIKANFNQA